MENQSTVRNFVKTHIYEELYRIRQRLKTYAEEATENKDRLAEYFADNLHEVSALNTRRKELEDKVMYALRRDEDAKIVVFIEETMQGFKDNSKIPAEQWTRHKGSLAWQAEGVGQREGYMQLYQSFQALYKKLQSLPDAPFMTELEQSVFEDLGHLSNSELVARANGKADFNWDDEAVELNRRRRHSNGKFEYRMNRNTLEIIKDEE